MNKKKRKDPACTAYRNSDCDTVHLNSSEDTTLPMLVVVVQFVAPHASFSRQQHDVHCLCSCFAAVTAAVWPSPTVGCCIPGYIMLHGLLCTLLLLVHVQLLHYCLAVAPNSHVILILLITNCLLNQELPGMCTLAAETEKGLPPFAVLFGL